MSRSFLLFLLIMLAVYPGQIAAKDVTRTYNSPAINGVRLDWCKHWASQCGAPAAELFCRQNGYTRAARFVIDPLIGARGIATVVFGDGRLCNAPTCSGFLAITCSKPGPVERVVQPKAPKGGQILATPEKTAEPAMTVVVLGPDTTRFANPKIKNVRVNWCRNWGRSCGQPAAALFCREMGFANAANFSIDKKTGPGGIPTLVFGDGRICAGKSCNGFGQITCTRENEKIIEAEKPSDTKPGVAATGLAPKPGQAAVPVPRPRPITRPNEQQTAAITINPAVRFDQFKPLAPAVVAANWANILTIVDTYPEGAKLFKCASGDCSLASSADFEIDPSAQFQSVQLNFKVDTVPYAAGANWQIGYLPFPPFSKGAETDLDPPGLLGSGTVETREGWFAFDLNDLSKGLPGGATQAIFHVRVLPVTLAGSERVVGQPSKTMRIFYGANLPPQEPYVFYTKEEVQGSKPQVRLTHLEFKPFKRVERWPPGCKTWEEKYGKKKSVLEKVGKFFSDAWNWTSKSYQWVKDRAIDIASALTFNLIPESVLEFGLNSALVSVGIPPDIPNLNELMKDGIDGLAREVAKASVQQIPSADLASNVGNLAVDITIDTATNMAEEELRERLEKEIEKHSRQALLQAADEMEKQLISTGKGALCDPTYFHPVYRVTVENIGDQAYRDLAVRVNAAPVYQDRIWKIDIAPGEKLTLASVAAPRLPNGPYSHPLLRPKQREEEDMGRWWNEIVHDEMVEIEVTLPGSLLCLGGDSRSRFCDRESVLAHRSPPQYVIAPYKFP